MKVCCAILIVCLLSAVSTIAKDVECESSFKRGLCSADCALFKWASGTCVTTKGKDNCKCYTKRSLPDFEFESLEVEHEE